jgi:hypothetical protein
MAEIDIQEKKGPSPWVWVAVAVGVLLLVGVIWAVTQNGDTRDRDAMPADTVRDTAPATWDTAPPAGDTWDTVPPAGDTWDTVPGAGDPGATRDGAGGEYLRLGFQPERNAA